MLHEGCVAVKLPARPRGQEQGRFLLLGVNVVSPYTSPRAKPLRSMDGTMGFALKLNPIHLRKNVNV